MISCGSRHTAIVTHDNTRVIAMQVNINFQMLALCRLIDTMLWYVGRGQLHVQLHVNYPPSTVAREDAGPLIAVIYDANHTADEMETKRRRHEEDGSCMRGQVAIIHSYQWNLIVAVED
jgi:hypothetical protein